MKYLFYLEAMKVYIHLPRLFLILAYYCAQSGRKKTTKRRDSALLSSAKPSGMGNLHDVSFYFYDQNPSGFCFVVQIKAFVF